MLLCKCMHVRYSPVWPLSAWRECEWKSRSCCGWVLAYPSCWSPWTFVSPSEDYNISFFILTSIETWWILHADFSHDTNDKQFISLCLIFMLWLYPDVVTTFTKKKKKKSSLSSLWDERAQDPDFTWQSALCTALCDDNWSWPETGSQHRET